LKEIELLLLEKRQLIFYGPPGTSKTYTARVFSAYFAQNTDNIEIIQFHQSYSYEDFVEGIKPAISKSGGVEFIKQPGLFKDLVSRCIANPEKRFVLIIDEINRGNISKIIGELIYLLEYRNEKISLAYSPDEKFYIPTNLYIIGTMNSADRSIAFVDYALRRRFHFIDFYPESTNRILSDWSNENATEVEIATIVEMLNQINQKIKEQLGKEYQIGHSYFMVKHLNHDKLRMIMKYAIIPLVEQYYFGKEKYVNDIVDIYNNTMNFSSRL
jgi:5-methylcytosine-specific restriction protein B